MPAMNDLRAGIFCFGTIDDRLKIFARGFGRQSAQTVVGAELQNQNVDAISQQPVDPAQAAGTGVAALAGVDDFELPPFGVDFFLNEGGIRLFQIESVSGGDAVA